MGGEKSSKPDIGWILEELPYPVSYVDRDGMVQRCNATAAKLIGRPAAEVVGQSVDAVLTGHPDLRDLIEQGLRSKEQSAQLNVVSPEDPGRMRCFHVRVRPHHAEQGKLQGVLLTGEDVSSWLEMEAVRERVERDRELSAALNRINGLIHSTQDIRTIMSRVIVEAAEAVGAESAVIYVNEQDDWVARYTYGPLDSIRDRHFSDQELRDSIRAIREGQAILINDARADPDVNRDLVMNHGVRAVLDVALQMAERVVGDFGLYYHTPGKHFTEAEKEFVDKVGASVGLALQNADRFTRLKKAEVALRESDAALRRTNAELQQFAYLASHDLRAPLRAVSNLASWIEEDLGPQLSGESRNHVRLLRDRVRLMDAYIQGLLTYSRAGGRTTRVEEVDTAQLVKNIFKGHDVAGMHLTVAENMPRLVTDRTKLCQVFANLIGNAIQYQDHPNGEIRVAVEDADEFYDFSVADNGPGIPPEFQERIFLMLQRGPGSEKTEGTGIGLAVVKKLVEDAGGRIEVESAPGQGATFRFTWPKVMVPDASAIS
ncbi:ATP-binding protein [Thiohalomonas denitrificans]|uniref:histidine kinase n=1 Tax=Thiohalomonas denitrificans TaxID=415747 RepID=A0A1G5PVD3_9GAMM|nr:ATP-binding protein [Thiohalomonas denitrificans]SCZ53524.1 PAS domain S-box-containing protein [Thiohalomonas denitrificans]